MAMAKHDQPRHEVATRRHDLFDRFFDDWPEAFRRPFLFWPERALDPMRVEEFAEKGALVVRVEVPGIDPARDAEVSVVEGTLHIRAERREDEESEGRNYVRKEHRYGLFQRDIDLPKGISEGDVNASYKDGILEVRVPLKKEELQEARTIPIAQG